MIDENRFIKKATEITIKYAKLSEKVRDTFNSQVAEIGNDNLITPEWFDRRDEALERIYKVKALIDQLIEMYKASNISCFKEMVSIDADLDATKKEELLSDNLKAINNSSLQVGAFFSLIKSHFGLAEELFQYVEDNSDSIYVEEGEIVFETDTAINVFNRKIEEMTLIFNQLKEMEKLQEDKLRSLAEKVGIALV